MPLKTIFRSRRSWYLALILLSLSASCALAGNPASCAADPWPAIGSAITATFAPIKPGMSNFNLDFSLWSGSSLLSTGTIGISNSKTVWFGLRSPQSSFRYLSQGASISCLLVTPSDTVLFHAKPGEYSPFPLVRIDKEASGGFRLDLTVNYRTFNGSEPAEFSVHPETAAYLTAKLRDRYPMVRESAEEYRLRASENASDSVILEKGKDGIGGFVAHFPMEGQPPLKLQVSPLNVTGPFPTPPDNWIPAGGRTPSSGLDATVTFCKGFYSILSEILQPATTK
ncbi:MAG TPA: hypothetical protein PKO06_04290 [Candidatus Ozemobacteraceae bacterium]|nr:hypothetical protein [Candidatus Ozemobacteraceae bacterium]